MDGRMMVEWAAWLEMDRDSFHELTMSWDSI